MAPSAGLCRTVGLSKMALGKLKLLESYLARQYCCTSFARPCSLLKRGQMQSKLHASLKTVCSLAFVIANGQSLLQPQHIAHPVFSER